MLENSIGSRSYLAMGIGKHPGEDFTKPLQFYTAAENMVTNKTLKLIIIIMDLIYIVLF